MAHPGDQRRPAGAVLPYFGRTSGGMVAGHDCPFRGNGGAGNSPAGQRGPERKGRRAHGLRRRVLQGDGQTGLLQVRAIPVQRSDGRLGESRGHRQGNRLWCGIPLRVHRRRLLRQNGVHPLEGDASRLRGDERGPSLPRSFRPSPRAERHGVMARLQRGIHPPERPLGERRS